MLAFYFSQNFVVEIDRSWMRMDRRTDTYDKGVTSFIEFAKNNLPAFNEKLRCPCLKCENMRILNVVEVKEHLFWNGIDVSYDRRISHGESPRCETSSASGLSSRANMDSNLNVDNEIEEDGMEELVHDVENIFSQEPS